MNLDTGLPSAFRKVHEHIKVTKDCEALSEEEFYCVFVAGHGFYIEKVYSSLSSFRNKRPHQLSANAFVPMGFCNYERLHFCFVSFDDQSCETDYSETSQGNPDIASTNLGQMIVKIVFGMLSAYRRVSVDFAMPTREFAPQ